MELALYLKNKITDIHFNKKKDNQKFKHGDKKLK